MQSRFTSQKFNTYDALSKSAKNWDIHCAYQLLPHALEGENHVIQLPSIQLSYSNREGGFMHSAVSPRNSVSIAVIRECRGVASFDRMKLKKGDIVFFDDTNALHFMSKDKISVAIVSIPDGSYPALQKYLHTALGHRIKDRNGLLSSALQNILTLFMESRSLPDLQKAEDEIMAILFKLSKTETIEKPKLTKGERIAFDILEQVYGHMDGTVNIKDLAKQYAVSEHTLQKSFKAIFGFTPKRFFRLLKLNHVHHELKNADPGSYSVSRIAQKWGFRHMGRFSHYYTELFGENPSLTLDRPLMREAGMTGACASRQEEMESV